MEKERLMKSLEKTKEQAQWAIWSIVDFERATEPVDRYLAQAEGELKDALLAIKKARFEWSRS